MCVPDSVRTVYMAVQGPCTVYTAVCTAVFTARMNGRVLSTTYHVHGRAWSVHDPNTAVYTVVYPVHGRVYGPCTVHGP